MSAEMSPILPLNNSVGSHDDLGITEEERIEELARMNAEIGVGAEEQSDPTIQTEPTTITDAGLRPVKDGELTQLLQEKPEILDPESDDELKEGAAASMAMEPWTLDLDNSESSKDTPEEEITEHPTPQSSEPSESTSPASPHEDPAELTVDPATPPEDSLAIDPPAETQSSSVTNEELENVQNKFKEAYDKRKKELLEEGLSKEDVEKRLQDEYLGIDSDIRTPKERIGDVVTERIDELESEGLSSSDAHAQAHDEFWGKPPTDPPVETPPEEPPVETPPEDPPVETPPEEPPVETPPEDTEEPIRIAIGNLDRSVDAESRDIAGAEVDRQTQGRGIRGFLRKIWRGGSFKEVHIQRARLRARDEILESGELYVHRTGENPSQEQVEQSVIEKLTHQNIDQLLSEESGETHRRIDDESDPEAQAIRGAVTDLISRYASGELDDDNFEEEKNRVLHELAQTSPELLGEGRMFADNLLLIAQNVQSMVRHDRGVEDIMANAVIDLGQIRTDARTEARYSRTDALIERVHNTRLGRWMNETTIVTLASIATSATKLTIQSGVGNAAKVTGVLGLGGALIAGARQSKVVKDERRQHARDMAAGEHFEPGAARRRRMEESRYDTISAVDATTALQQLFEQAEDGTNLRRLQELTPEGFLEASMLVAQLRARELMSDREQIDLFHYSSAESISDERFQMQLTAIYAESALQEYLEERGGISWLESVGIVDSINNYDDLLNTGMLAYESAITQDISEKDAVFKSIQRREVLRAALIGGFAGVVIGATVQEAMAHLPGIGDHIYGIGEGKAMPGGRSTPLGEILNKGGGPQPTGNLLDVGGHGKLAEVAGFKTHQTKTGGWIVERTLDGKSVKLDYDKSGLLTPGSKSDLARMGFDVTSKVDTTPLSGEVQNITIGNNKITLPTEFRFHQLSDPGHFEILNPNGSKVQDVRLNFDGSFTDQTIDQLQKSGVGVTNTPHLVTDTVTVGGRSPGDIIQNHLSGTTRVARNLWYAGNTNTPDLNELRLHAGGVNGSWFDEQGNVVIDISKMKPNWSFQNGHSVNPFLATLQGRLFASIAMSRGTQNSVFEFQLHTMPNGHTIATFPPSSPVHQLFEMQGGHRIFKGGFIEVVEHTGESSNGAQNINVLATYEGQNNPGGLTDVVTTTKTVYNTIVTPKPPIEHIDVITYKGPTLVEAAPVIPYYARRGLEASIPKDPEERYNYYTYGLPSEEDLRELERDTLPVLLDDPRAIVETGEAVRWYQSVLRRRHGQEYVAEIESIVENSPELQSIDNEADAIITIPVGGFEGDHIFQTLSLYGQQPKEETEHTPILLHVNWRASDVRTVEGQRRLQATFEAINKAKVAYPGLNITVIQSAWTDEEAENGIIGLATRKLYDVAILATQDAIEDGRMDSSHEVVIIRNDADMKGMSQNYINRIVQATTSDSADASVGRLEWGIEQSKDLPGFAVVMQVLEGIRGSAKRARDAGIDVNIQTAGANTAVRLSTLASVGSVGFSDYTGAGSDDLEIGRRISLVRRASSPLHTGSSYSRRARRSLRSVGRRISGTRHDGDYLEGNDGDSTVVIANGASVDTDPSRLEASYRNGEPIGHAWAGFNIGGHRSRITLLPEDLSGEDLDADFEKIVHNIETQLVGVFSDWVFDRRLVEMELRRSFPPEHGTTDQMYELATDDEGRLQFKFTDAGKDLLKKRLTRNNKGEFDPIGSRRLRVNYGRPTKKRKFPTNRTPRLVGARS